MVLLIAHFPFYNIPFRHQHVLLDEEMNNASNFQQLARAQLSLIAEQRKIVVFQIPLCNLLDVLNSSQKSHCIAEMCHF